MKTFRRRQTGARNGSAASSLLGRFWLPFCLLFGLAYFAWAQSYYAAHESASRQTRYEQKAIESVALHDRLSGYNPLPPDTDRDVPEPTPETHRALRLELVKEDGSLLKLRLVRSLDWIEAEEAQPGRTVFMDLPEFGAVGEATVLAMEPCPAVPPGSGNLVTGIFEHTSGSVIDLYLEGAAEPIGCTANHRFWSKDREDYVEAGELRPGERVWTRKLGTTAVVGNAPRSGTHRVWNLEIHGEHVYEVGELGTLVHNSYGRNVRGSYWESGKKVFPTYETTLQKIRVRGKGFGGRNKWEAPGPPFNLKMEQAKWINQRHQELVINQGLNPATARSIVEGQIREQFRKPENPYLKTLLNKLFGI